MIHGSSGLDLALDEQSSDEIRRNSRKVTHPDRPAGNTGAAPAAPVAFAG